MAKTATKRMEAGSRGEMHLRIMVEQAVREGKSEREIVTLLRQAEARDRPLPRAA